jgi:hypothetical protein
VGFPVQSGQCEKEGLMFLDRLSWLWTQFFKLNGLFYVSNAAIPQPDAAGKDKTCQRKALLT